MALRRKSRLLPSVLAIMILNLSACTGVPTAGLGNKALNGAKSDKKYGQLIRGGKFRTTQKSIDNKFIKSHPKSNTAPKAEEGYASWYASWFHGRKTFSGVKYDEFKYSAAHRTLPIPSVVRVTNLSNKKQVIVVINDRGPFKGGEKRIIDVSKRAAKDLDFITKGIAKVRVEYLVKETKELLKHLPQAEKDKALMTLSYLQ